MRIRTTLFAVALATTALLGGAGAAAADGLPLFSHASGSGSGVATSPMTGESKGERRATVASELDFTPGGLLSRFMGV
ncbi:hypothetical protein AB0I10_03715 [Streptomyces sp. NPDC050636]|uniref:hypothetical protein n=1 Tax=Streptomyces sp. NPDC050636 TaxID=3154510 RepID=UPI003448C527